ncbi:paired amphipathic helix protein Sin3-like 5 [Phalaenopsis equestris]|uniref:paired amphipathic helix protein Sin3-like 5 n=1 Tax=Phalaenopsis equestris TaxID=78828 RepID=UPI0009E4AE22|nr:paired amphipathic helix protein Sin3-like 5 [Phalaenopsis equestris]XP_020572500.1 paired amphipathic helix protein Sin3-like 5 [Phalaenopsis equestris]XP_020572501.1 paired amphipathic helix protein Sin3-like 5 [Phalaenopsis equestris]XP_020572502.1 paired amphipathic helix protein Sin3-like 5 [Phalaenopsis equestris]
MGTNSAQKLSTNDAVAYLKAVKDLLHDNNEKYNQFLNIMKDFKTERIDTDEVIMRVQELFKEHPELIIGFRTFVPKGYKIKIPAEKKPVEFQEAFIFVNKIKRLFQNDEHTYRSFLDILNMYRMEIKSISDVYQEVALLFKNHKDLFMEFLRFLPDAPSSTTHNASSGRPLMRNVGHPSTEKVEDRDKDKELERDYTNRGLESDKDRENKLINRESPSVSKVEANHEVSLLNPISDPHPSSDGCTPSYILLPENCCTPPGRKTELGLSVLNDVCVSVASGSEDYSSYHREKNQYEEILFKCEDDRYEMDMLLESVKSTAKRVELLLERMQHKIIKPDSPFPIEDHLTSLNLRCIERLYGDHGLEVMDALHESAGLALPVILTRLKQKQAEWSMCQAEFNKVWSEIFAENYHKWLNHSSLCSMQRDMKSSSPEAPLAEIAKLCERKRKENGVVLSLAAENQRPIVSKTEFEHLNPDIHGIHSENISPGQSSMYEDKLLEPELDVSHSPQTEETDTE